MEELWQRYLNKRDEEGKKKLIMEYFPLVKEIARIMSFGLPSHIEYDDLVSWGVLGLIDALDKYRPEKGSKFRSYAAVRIKGSILDELRRYSWAPRSLLQNIKKVERAFQLLESQRGREVTPGEVAEYMGVSKEYVEKVLGQVNCCSLVSLEAVLFDSQDQQGRSLIDTLPAPGGTPEEALEKKEKVHLLKEALNKLTEKEQLLLNLYYQEELTMKEIGLVMDLSESRVSQVHSRAIMKLRGTLVQEEP